MSRLAPFVSKDLIGERLPLIFPQGTPQRLYCTRDLAASTVFAALYVGAVEGSGRYFGPAHVYRMTTEQAAMSDSKDREDFDSLIRRKKPVPGNRWYADNTRESIRDETLKNGLVAIGAVVAREDLPTTAQTPRYALKNEFAALFDPALENDALEAAIAMFQANQLSKGALARVTIMQAGAMARSTAVLVSFPNGETRSLAPGPSSFIAKRVVEDFAARFLQAPAVLWLSESGNKVVVRDERIATALGIKIEADKNLPDLILADLGPQEPLIVFVEVVATDGAITAGRKQALLALTEVAGFDSRNVMFVTSYEDRESAGFRKTIAQLAWGTYAWFASEPEKLLIMRDAGDQKLRPD